MTAIAPFTLVPVAPTGSHTSLCFVSRSADVEGKGGGMDELEIKSYPPSVRGAELRAVRHNVHPPMHLGHLSRIIGVSTVDVSDLERGCATLANSEEWERLFAVVRAAKERPTI